MQTKVRSTSEGSSPTRDAAGPAHGAPDASARLTPEQAETLIVDTVQRNAESLLRTARRHSLCADDAQEAYQRAMEIFVRRAATLDPDRAAKWLHTVTKHEAMAVRDQRQQIVASEDIDFDRHEARNEPSPDERIVSYDQLTRSAEALQRLKPNEMRALWLKASGQPYSAIAEAQGWTYTKVNRLITEGRRAFLARYADIETGRECERWAPVINALIDGEATAAMLTEARPHLRNCPACRAMIRELRDTNASLAIVLPVATTATTAMAAGGHHEPVTGLAMRLYEAVTGGVHERVASSALKIQAGVEMASAGKVAAVVAASAAVAGGGIAVIDHDVVPRRAVHHARSAHVVSAHGAARHGQAAAGAGRVVPAALPASAVTPTVQHTVSRGSSPARSAVVHHHHHHPARREFDPPSRAAQSSRVSSEFSRAPAHAAAAAPVVRAPVVRAPVVSVHIPSASSSAPAHIPTSSGVAKGGEFGP